MKCQPFTKHGEPIHRPELENQLTFDIIAMYQSIYRGIVSFYRMAHKFRISVPKVYRRYRVHITGEDGQKRSGLEVWIERRGKAPLGYPMGRHIACLED